MAMTYRRPPTVSCNDLHENAVKVIILAKIINISFSDKHIAHSFML